MNTDPIAELIDHPPRDDAPADPALAGRIMGRVRVFAAHRRQPRWWPLAIAVALAIALLPAEGQTAWPDGEMIGLLLECLAGGAALLAALAIADRAVRGASWTAS